MHIDIVSTFSVVDVGCFSYPNDVDFEACGECDHGLEVNPYVRSRLEAVFLRIDHRGCSDRDVTGLERQAVSLHLPDRNSPPTLAEVPAASW